MSDFSSCSKLGKSMSMSCCLSSDLEREILIRLPSKTLLRFQCVCKRWLDEIKTPNFTRSHALKLHETCTHISDGSSLVLYNYVSLTLRSMSIDFHAIKELEIQPLRLPRTIPSQLEDYTIIGSCNGLLCFRDLTSQEEKFSLYNPIISSNYLHTVPSLFVSDDDHSVFGFGYDSVSDDYKLVYSSSQRRRVVGHHVYSLKSNSWKFVQHPFVVLNSRFSFLSSMVLSNNALHWVGCYESDNERETKRIFSFDLGTEECREVPQPEDEDGEFPNGLCRWVLADLKGCLHLVKYIVKSNNLRMWVMNKYGSKQSWSKFIHNISLEDILKSIGVTHLMVTPLPCAYSDDGFEILLDLRLNLAGIIVKYQSTAFVRYDLRLDEVDTVEMHGLFDGTRVIPRHLVLPWIASLVSLPSPTT